MISRVRRGNGRDGAASAGRRALRGLLRLGLILAAGLGSGGAAAGEAQTAASAAGRVSRVSVYVDAAGPEPAVRVLCRLRLPPDAGPIPVEALVPRGAEVADLRARVGEDEFPVRLEGEGPVRRGTVDLPRGGGNLGEPVAIELTYRVLRGVAREDGALDLRAPVVQVPWAPEEALPGTFRAEVRLPPGLEFVEGFPSRWTAEPEGLIAAELPVPARWVSVRGGPPDRGGVSLPRGLELLAVGTLVLFGGGFYRHLRAEAGA